jgi:type II secretory pathway component GspD/PulD (secretin)
MVFQANKWGWKALAAKLLLAPVLAGSLATPAFAQTGAKGQPAAATASSDPKELLKRGRKALAEGRYDQAVELASSAAAGNASGRWGLFGDSPDSLVKDTQAARAKADKVAAGTLIKEAKALYARKATSEADRIANLDAAALKIDQAVTLNGSSDWLDDINPLADKPESVKREIDSARAAIRKNLPAMPADARAVAPIASGVRQVAGTATTAGVRQAKFELEQAAKAVVEPMTADKTRAVSAMKDGRGLMAEGKLAEARNKFVEAAKTGATFTLAEDNPDKCLQELAEKGKSKVDGLVNEAQKYTAAKDYPKAEAALQSAKEAASSLDLWSRGIDLELDSVKKLAGSTQLTSADLPGLPTIGVPNDTAKADSTKADSTKADAPKADKPSTPPLPSIPTPEMPKLEAKKADSAVPSLPVVLDDKPSTDKPTETIELPKIDDDKKTSDKKAEPVDVTPMPPMTPITEPVKKADSGRKLLDQATTELKRGELELARKLAVEVHNGDYGLKDDAQKLMVVIDAELKVGKSKEAVNSLDAAKQAISAKQFEYADRLLSLIEKNALPEDKQKQYDVLVETAAKEVAKLKAPAAKVDTAKAPGMIPSTPTTTTANGGALEQAKTLSEAELQQLRVEGLQVQSQALKAFEKGETDVAVQLLTDYSTKVKASKLSAARQRLLLDPVDVKLDSFRLIKRQVDLYTKDAKDKKDRMEGRLAKTTAEQQKQEEIKKRVQAIKELMEKKQFAEAEKWALQAKSLEPDNETLALIHKMAQNNRRADEAQRLKSEREVFTLNGLNDADKYGQAVNSEDPLAVNIKRSRQASGRTSSDDTYVKPKSVIERQIELKLEQPLTLEFKQASLREVIDKFADLAKINLIVDEPAIAAVGLDLEKVMVNEKISQPISLRNVMQVILDKYRLQFVVENDVVQVTTQTKAKGRMYTKVYSVMDLVTPIPDFALPEHASLDKTFQRLSNPTQPWMSASSSAGLGNGQMVSQPQNQPWAPNGGFAGKGGILENQSQPGGTQINPLSSSAFLAPNKANHSDQLMKLIKGMVRPHSWDEGGGAGKLSYYDIGGALVVNQTADVIREVNDLLESLRRLQDLSVSVEVRIISLSESFFERIGVDFQMNIKTNTSKFEPSLTTGQFRPAPFINDIGTKGVVTGWDPTRGGFTPDLDVPIRPNTYGFSAPPFGGYPGNGNGGLNLGLAFLNDIQVFMFLEAAAGDRRANVMQAPKLTLFNGQTANVSVSDFTFFTTGLQVFNVGGQFVYLPTNTPFPTGATVVVQAVVSSDRRFVRMNITPQISEITSATVPLFPVTAFITPVFEGGSQGTPIPFTQFFQQPSFNNINIQSTVVVPDGGTVLLGGIKTMSEGRNEFGPPVLSNIPYLNRLFRNTGVGRETRHVMLMVTPRIIITSEEEAVQTGNALSGTGN